MNGQLKQRPKDEMCILCKDKSMKATPKSPFPAIPQRPNRWGKATFVQTMMIMMISVSRNLIPKYVNIVKM